MRIVVPLRRESLRMVLRWTQRAFFAGAALILAYCTYVPLDAWFFQRQQSRELERLWTTTASRTTPPAVAVADGLIGRIEIPRLGVSAIVIEGSGTSTLRRAVGHIHGTALPGQVGNVGIAGHRDTYFRPLRNIRKDDIIELTTLLGAYRYRVVSTAVVGPSDVGVLDPGRNETLTLVTCYPFYFVGSAPGRFIVRAERVGNAS